MITNKTDLLQHLDKQDQEKVLYFAELLLKQSKYQLLKEEIDSRRNEIKQGQVLSHNEIWNELNV